MKNALLTVGICFLLFSCAEGNQLKKDFSNPPNKYRPMPFWHLNGHLTTEGITKQITEAKDIAGFGGVTVLPVTAGPQHPTGLPCPGMTPAFLSDEYFARYIDMLTVSQKQGTEIILYDDVDFPSGSAGGRLLKEYPQYSRKFMAKDEFMVKGGTHLHKEYTLSNEAVLMAVSAMNTSTLEVVDLQPFYKENILDWNVPVGEWRVMFFNCRYSVGGAHGHIVDYMQPEAVSKVMEMTYNEYDKRFSKYFGNVITKSFFDDVGFVHMEETWTPAITEIFKEKYGKNPALYYPALYYDIGIETQQARVAFYDIRSELMAEGYVKQVSEWSGKRHLQSMGHPPENYSPNSVVAHGDILKYYRHVHIPLLDAIFYYGRGLNGFKQVSSAADLYDRPVVGAELCGAFPADMDSLTLYRVALESMVRGVNFIVPHGMWYDTDPSKVRIPPLIAPENPLLKDCLPHYNLFTARSCMMLQGGKRVCDIALLWPITAIQGESYINRDAQSGLPVATWLPENVNHHILSDLLTNQIRRDFTFVHPEDLNNGKITANGKELVLNNKINIQNYKVLIMPGGEVISAETLKNIKNYYNNGGKVIATASLPFKASEFGRDKEVQDIIKEIFGSDFISGKGIPSDDIYKENKKGGQFAFVKVVDKAELNKIFNKMELEADIQFEEASIPAHNVGYLNYTHKQKDGLDIYYITNTTENRVATSVRLLGDLNNVEIWNPHTGKTEKAIITDKGKSFTQVKIDMPRVSSLFIVASK